MGNPILEPVKTQPMHTALQTPIFPSLVPTRRDVTVGRYPVKTFQAIDGVSTSRLYGSRRFNSQLSLEFSGISDAEVLSIAEAYDNSFGGALLIQLPDTIWKNLDPALKQWLADGYSWKFVPDSPPRVQQLVLGRFVVSLDLVGSLSIQ